MPRINLRHQQQWRQTHRLTSQMHKRVRPRPNSFYSAPERAKQTQQIFQVRSYILLGTREVFSRVITPQPAIVFQRRPTTFHLADLSCCRFNSQCACHFVRLQPKPNQRETHSRRLRAFPNSSFLLHTSLRSFHAIHERVFNFWIKNNTSARINFPTLPVSSLWRSAN